MLRNATNFRKNTSGASLVEFALVVPIFLMLVLGILAFGVLLSLNHSTAQLAADAARVSVAGLTDDERRTLAERHVIQNADMYSLISPSRLTAAAGIAPNDPTSFVVTVRYDASDLPIWHFSSFIPMPNKIIERSAVIKRGGF